MGTGAAVGIAVGTLVGGFVAVVGCEVGTGVGMDVGAGDGPDVVGVSVGVGVGKSLGAGVGAGVGVKVSTETDETEMDDISRRRRLPLCRLALWRRLWLLRRRLLASSRFALQCALLRTPPLLELGFGDLDRLNGRRRRLHWRLICCWLPLYYRHLHCCCWSIRRC